MLTCQPGGLGPLLMTFAHLKVGEGAEIHAFIVDKGGLPRRQSGGGGGVRRWQVAQPSSSRPCLTQEAWTWKHCWHQYSVSGPQLVTT